MNLDSVKLFLRHVLDYQKLHHIENECVTNVMYVYDTLKTMGLPVCAKAVYYTWMCPLRIKVAVCAGHLILLLDGEKLEVSYEFLNGFMSIGVYTDTLRELVEVQHTLKDDKQFLSKSLELHTHFKRLAERINSGELIVSNSEYYHQLHDYVAQKMQKTGWVET